MLAHVCSGTQNDCYNPYDSYGEICVHCNCCGRIDKATMHKCRIETDKRHLEETREHLTDPYCQSEVQQKNIRLSIQQYLDCIAASEKAVLKGE